MLGSRIKFGGANAPLPTCATPCRYRSSPTLLGGVYARRNNDSGYTVSLFLGIDVLRSFLDGARFVFLLAGTIIAAGTLYGSALMCSTSFCFLNIHSSLMLRTFLAMCSARVSSMAMPTHRRRHAQRPGRSPTCRRRSLRTPPVTAWCSQTARVLLL